jgi:hypothetical protein
LAAYNRSQAQLLYLPNLWSVLTKKFYLADSTQSAGIATGAWLQTVGSNLIELSTIPEKQ